MEKHFSIYLDAVRFLMAFLVFFYHSSFPNFLAWLPWVNVGHHAVIVFFVLSGLVISYVVEVKEKTLSSYLISRVSRIYSVLIPTLIVTTIALYVGLRANPEIYQVGIVSSSSIEIFYAITGNFLMLNQHGWFRIGNFGNTPIWSLCYEFWYYMIFAAFIFPKSHLVRAILCIGLSIFVGIKVLVLFPAWILGAILHKYYLRKPISVSTGYMCFVLPVALYLIAYFLDWPDKAHDITKNIFGPQLGKLGFSQHFVFDYAFSFAIAIHFVGANKIAAHHARFLEYFQKPIRFLASYTFTLYLLHYPLLHVYAAVTDHDPANVTDGLRLWGLTLGTIFLIGALTENRRHILKRALVSAFAERSPVQASSTSKTD